MVVLAESGATVVWVGEHGVRYYAHGRPLAESSRLLIAQAEKVSNRDLRLDVARAMYEMRFPGEDVSKLTMQQLRGREGVRVRHAYRANALRAGITWTSRDYKPDAFEDADVVNQALSAATTCLYGAVHAVVVSLGCSPGLGFVHTGNARSFVYDIADLYKTEIAVPVAFGAAALDLADITGHVRRAMRDRMFEAHLLERCVKDIRVLLVGQDNEESNLMADGATMLWDGRRGAVSGGTSYGAEFEAISE